VSKCSAAMLALAAALFASPASADAPEQLYEHGPAAGEFEIEYNGQAGDGDPAARPHSLEVFAGVSDRIAIGIEVEGEMEEGKFRTEEYALGVLIGLNDETAPVTFSVLVQAGLDRDGNFPQSQLRLIAEHGGESWNWNGNLIARRRKGDESGSAIAYATTLHYQLAEQVAFGIEASGQAARLSGFSGGFDKAHYLGPSLQLKLGKEGGPEVELGIKYLRRIDHGSAYRDTLRLTAGLSF
jgi:hypothetical protein